MAHGLIYPLSLLLMQTLNWGADWLEQRWAQPPDPSSSLPNWEEQNFFPIPPTNVTAKPDIGQICDRQVLNLGHHDQAVSSQRDVDVEL